MADKRTTRVKKQIDYSKFSGMDSENDFPEDDDFENFTPPISKKLKTEKKAKKEKESTKTIKSPVIVHPEPTPKRANPRKSLDDKVFEKELELALQLSKSGSSQTGKEIDEIIENKVEKNSVCEKISDKNGGQVEVQEKQNVEKPNVQRTSINPSAVIIDNDTIEILEENIADGPEKRAVSKKRVYDDCSDLSDDDFDGNGQSDDSESDFNLSDDDMEFTTKKPKKNNSSKIAKSVPNKKVTTTSKANKKPGVCESKSASKADSKPNLPAGSGKSVKKPRLAPATSIVPKKLNAPSMGLNKSCSKSPLASKTVHTTFKSPSNVSQSPGLGGMSLKSPSCGALRLGLSRNARLKPLHANVKVTPSAR